MPATETDDLFSMDLEVIAFRMGDDHGAERRARRAEVSSCAASAHQTVLAETADPAAAREAARKAAATAQRRAA